MERRRESKLYLLWGLDCSHLILRLWFSERCRPCLSALLGVEEACDLKALESFQDDFQSRNKGGECLLDGRDGAIASAGLPLDSCQTA